MEGETGQTIGKKMLGIKVIQQNGDPSTVGTSFVRHLFDCIDFFVLIGIIIALTNVNKARIGDLVAKTYVVGNVIGNAGMIKDKETDANKPASKKLNGNMPYTDGEKTN